LEVTVGNAEWTVEFDGTELFFEGVVLVDARYLDRQEKVEFGPDYFVGDSGDRYEIDVNDEEPTPYVDEPETLYTSVQIDGQHVKKLEQIDTSGSGVIYTEVFDE
jgi:hypothetical protein